MSKQLLTIGFEIPGFSKNYTDFHKSSSLMDADVVLISPESIEPIGEWVSFTAGGGCYNVDASKRFEERLSHLKKEMLDFLNSGKNVFLLLSFQKEFQLATSVSTPRKSQYTYNTKSATNYDFLPIHIGTLISASGKQLKYSGNSMFSVFHKHFTQYLKYELYIENSETTHIIYYGKDNKKVLGALYKVGIGHLVVLPMLTFDNGEFTTTRKESNGSQRHYWNRKGLAFGNTLVECLLDIDRKLEDDSEKTPPPAWTTKEQFFLKKEIVLTTSIMQNFEMISKLEQENEKLKIQLAAEVKLKDLLFETGKALEDAVIKALRLLGYEAENYNDGELEMDQVIISPEKHRYIGECEGKDNKDVDVTKFRQLQDALNADFVRDEVDEKAFGILFGNAERLKEPKDRKLDFTIKCKSGAEREKIALIKTADLFFVSKYLVENDDDNYKNACRFAIHQQLGKVVIFPTVPAKDGQTPNK